jgi:hypothetical protein
MSAWKTLLTSQKYVFVSGGKAVHPGHVVVAPSTVLRISAKDVDCISGGCVMLKPCADRQSLSLPEWAARGRLTAQGTFVDLQIKCRNYPLPMCEGYTSDWRTCCEMRLCHYCFFHRHYAEVHLARPRRLHELEDTSLVLWWPEIYDVLRQLPLHHDLCYSIAPYAIAATTAMTRRKTEHAPPVHAEWVENIGALMWESATAEP